MTPFDLCLYGLALSPTLMLVALLVNLVANNVATHRVDEERKL